MTDAPTPETALTPGLYIVATPIGNLGDITLRAVDVLRRCDGVACEDTRVTGKLLKHLGISKPMWRYDDHSEHRDRTRLVESMRDRAVALVSDAGTPMVSDPGYRLVNDCRAEGIPVTALPGACAAVTALALSGLPNDRFLFAGFLPNKDKARRETLEELADVARRAQLFSCRSSHLTLAVLVPTNRLGYEMADVLRSAGADFDEVLQSAHSARKVGDVLSTIVSFLADPLKRGHLEGSYRAMCSYWPTEEGPGDQDRVATLLRSCYRPEDLIYPQKGTRPEDALPQVGEIAPTDIRALGVFCRYMRRWIRATLLPVDQMLMAVAQDLMRNADMARAQKLASFLRARGDVNPSWRLPDFARELMLASRGKAASLLEDEDLFTPRPGRISLTTLHKAKGLEWDLVYIVGVDGDWFPYDLDDHFRGEYEFLGGDPGEEARAELLRLIGEWEPGRLSATHMAHVEVIAERMRLLYVAITRACRYLSVSWSRDIPMATRMRSVDQAVVYDVLSGINKGRDLGRTG